MVVINDPARIDFGAPDYIIQKRSDNVVETFRYEDGKVYINDTKFFGNVTEEAWNLFIGGYQPAQKWLKDRKGLSLTFSDIRHYHEIIHSLTQTFNLIHDSE
ncbi:MAG: hypothetical protein J1E95_11490 [Muribaculaceae bacterium]|nr:hypothetical protein [Muribaculaceae bacterium]